jgi:curved DNA-binding protein CbpA
MFETNMSQLPLFKKIEDMDHYEILNIPLDATADEIESAYKSARSAYDENGLASYSLLSPEERREILARLEEAFETLFHFEKRIAYDKNILAARPEFCQHAYFRKSTARIEIDDADGTHLLFGRLKSVLHRFLGKKDREEPADF